MKTTDFTILIDSREQTPLSFPEGIQTESGTLTSGDYSLEGLEELVAIERKELSDLVGCITTDRERFKRELLRLRSYRCKAVVVECYLADILEHRYRALTEPESVIGSIASWQTRYDVPFVFAGNRDGAARYTLAILRNFNRICEEFAQQYYNKKQQVKKDA